MKKMHFSLLQQHRKKTPAEQNMQDHVVHFNIAMQEVILVMSNKNIHGCRVCVPLIPVLWSVIANINITTHGQAVSIATPSDSKSLHCLAELHLRQTKHSGIQQLVEESYTQTLNLAWSTEQPSCTCPESSDEKSSFGYDSGKSQLLHVCFSSNQSYMGCYQGTFSVLLSFYKENWDPR